MFMGMFDNIFDSKAPPKELSQADAFAGILFCASACDNRIAEAEVADLFSITDRLKLFKGLTDDDWNAMVHHLGKRIERDGVEPLLDECVAVLPEDLRDCAFANACDLILADGLVEEEEKVFLELLQKKLAIDGDAAMGIVEVMMIKNKG
jgi:hypothetical protein